MASIVQLPLFMHDKLTGRGQALGGGVVAGIVGGVLLSLVLLGGAVTEHQDVWMSMKGTAMPFIHDRATQPGVDAVPVLLGLGLRFLIAIIWGVLFAAIFYGLPKSATLLAGAVWGVVVWFVMFYVVLPLAGMASVAHASPPGPAIISHIIFGLALALAFLPYQRTRPRIERPFGSAPRAPTRTA